MLNFWPILRVHMLIGFMLIKKRVSQEFRFKNIDETKNFFREEIKQNELTSKKQKWFVQL